MRAAIYARRSTEEHQAASLDVQIDEARRFIAAKGWRVADAHVFVDSGVSRAEFQKRPGMQALLAAKQTRAFDVVVCRDETRLGGDTLLTGQLLGQLLQGARLFYYFTSEEVSMGTALEKLMVTVRNFTSESEREKISQRTREHLQHKARRGLVAGGTCYGYRNVELREQGRRVGVGQAIDPEQADVVRWIFSEYAAGSGLRTIVKSLNLRGVAPPRAGARGTGSWSTSAIHEMLRRERYRGRVVWGQRHKTYAEGTKVRIAAPESEWIRTDAPHLRIVDDALWTAVESKVAEKLHMGRASAGGAPPRYLLSGLSRCAACGGPIQTTNGRAGTVATKVYGCAYHRERGTCVVTLRRPVEVVDEAVCARLSRGLLSESVIVEAMQIVRAHFGALAGRALSDVPALEKHVRKVRSELARLGDALLGTERAPVSVMAMILEREAAVKALEEQIAALRAAPSVGDLQIRRLEQQARERLSTLGKLVSRNVKEAREALRGVLDGPLVWTPEGNRFRISGRTVGFSIGGVPSGTLRILNQGFTVAA